MKLPNSSSDFSVYSTNGEQLTGDLSGYNELAHQLDKKRSVLYFEASGTGIVLGTRLIVQIIGGRQERAIFIKKYAASEISMGEDFINRFYDDAKIQVENLHQIKYRVLGLLKEGDLPVQEQSITLSTILAIIGKILIREPVRIKIEDMSQSFGALRTIVEYVSQKKIPDYKIAIAQYPFNEDILISPNITGMDLEILQNGQEKVQSVFEKEQLLFQAISEIYDKQRTTLRNADFSDKNNFSRILKTYLIDSEKLNDIIKKNPQETREILDIYEDDPALLYRIIRKIFVYNRTLHGVDKKFITLSIDHIIKSVKTPDSEDGDLLKIGYNNGNDNVKNTIQHYLISNGIFEEYFLKDLLTTSIKKGNFQLLESVIANPESNDQILQNLTSLVNLHNFEQIEVLNFIENMFKLDFEQEPKGHSIYLAVVRQYQNQKFNTKKLNHLQDQYGRALNPLPQPTLAVTIFGTVHKKILIGIFVVLIVMAAIILVSFMGLPVPWMGGDQTPTHSAYPTIHPTPVPTVDLTLPQTTNETVNQTVPQTPTQTTLLITTQTHVIQNASNTSI